MNPVDAYLIDGCGRCALGGTPQCKVHRWTEELIYLRKILLATELTEEVKWSIPCYTYKGKNVIILSAFNENVTLSFLKGALMNDPQGMLEKPGENTQMGRVIRFTSIDQVIDNEKIIEKYIKEAIALEKAGVKGDYSGSKELLFPDELIEQFKKDPEFKRAFSALTPGRQRGYNLYFSAAKQSKTRIARIEKFRSKILLGKGMQDR